MIIRWIIFDLVTIVIIIITNCKYLTEGERIKCGQYNPRSTTDERVDGGDPFVRIGELPFVVDIQVTGNHDSKKNITINCSGAIISRTQVLTSIQCLAEVSTNATYTVRVGDIIRSKGRKIEADKNGIYFIETNGREPDCGEPLVRQGLAILKLRERLVYTLRGNAINRVCLRRGDKVFDIDMGGQSLNSSGWFVDKQELKFISLKSTICPMSNQLDLVCGAQTRNPDNFIFLQEGAPLFHNHYKDRWALVGIHSGSYNPWVTSCGRSKPSSLLAFIKLNVGIYREWLKSKLAPLGRE